MEKASGHNLSSVSNTAAVGNRHVQSKPASQWARTCGSAFSFYSLLLFLIKQDVKANYTLY